MRASDAHHHLSSNNIVGYDELEALFAEQGSGAAGGAKDIVGEGYQALLDELACITEYQWRSGEPHGLIKGFLLSGPPGTGKTTLAKRLAYEMGRRFQAADEPPVVMAFVDGGEISRSRYGESEERIRDIFLHAKSGFTDQGQRSVLLFDDVESIFMARGSEHAKEWHFSQDSVFFHAIDDLDTSRATVVLTSNRPDLIDDAIRDRFLSYVVDYPDVETLLRMVERIEPLQRLSSAQSVRLKDDLVAAIRSQTVRSMRDAQRFAMRHFVSNVLQRESIAQRIAD
ncbi:MAG TPA: ATP-binding protein [Alphaproteobacteria bacterium]|jgi:SpoVK/Ycf46/Vps4 family AAA+-type ATPase